MKIERVQLEMGYEVLAYIHILFDTLGGKLKKNIENRMYDKNMLRRIHSDLIKRKSNRRNGLVVATRVALISFLVNVGLYVYIKKQLDIYDFWIFAIVFIIGLFVLIFVRFSFVVLKEEQWNRDIEKGYPELAYELSL